MPPRRAVAEDEQLSTDSPWDTVSAPRQDPVGPPGQQLTITGRVLTHSPYINAGDVQDLVIGVTLLAGCTKPSLTIALGSIPVGASGTFAGALRIPYELPVLYGSRLTLLTQYASPLAPSRQILLNPEPAHRPPGR